MKLAKNIVITGGSAEPPRARASQVQYDGTFKLTFD